MDMADPRVAYILRHAERCREALNAGKERPGFPRRRADMTKADLSKADVSFATLSGIDFTEANLQETNFTGCDLSGTYMLKANTRGANFTGANIKDAGFTRKNIDSVKGLMLLGETYTKKWEERRRPRLIAQADETGKLRISAPSFLLNDE
jgi:hypothetical protein